MRRKHYLVVFLFIVLSGTAIQTYAQEQLRLTQLTDNPAQDGFPSWSPDGQTIVFSRYDRDEAPEKTGLWLLKPDSGESYQLTTFIAEHPDWSSDGNYIAFDGDYGDSIKLIAATGGTPIRIVPESIPVSRGGQPTWSPDGSRIAFKEGSNLWMLEVSTGRFDSFFAAGKLPIPTCWSHDGEELYLYMRDAETSTASIVAISISEPGERVVTPEEGAVYRYADLSPDDTLLVVTRCEGRNCDLYVMQAAGGKQIQITSHPEYDDAPAWSPDGSKIAFVSTRSGSFDIWQVEVDPEQLKQELDLLNQ